jgi:hypothetical protein
MDRLYVLGPGDARIVDLDLLALEQDVAAVSMIGARQTLDQCLFASAVVARQAHDFTGKKGNRDMIDCLDAPRRQSRYSATRPEGRRDWRSWEIVLI